MKSVLTVLFCFALGLAWSQNTSKYWQKIPGPPGGLVYPSYSNAADTLYGRCLNDLPENSWYRSIDGGNTWSRFPVLFNGQLIGNQITIGPSGTIFYRQPDPAGSLYGVYLWFSDDAGQTWQLSNTEPLDIGTIVETSSGVWVRTIHNFPDGTNTISRSIDHGVTWSSGSTYQGLGSGIVTAYPNQRVLWVRDTGSYSQVSNDDGATWTPIPVPITQFNLWVAHTGTLFAQLGPKVFCRSTNAGISWDTIPLVTADYNIDTDNPISEMTFLPSGKILAFNYTNNILIASEDDGVSWQRLETGLTLTGLSLGYSLPDGVVLASTWNALYRSQDEGESWTFSGYGVDHAQIDRLEIANDSTIFATTSSGIWRTLDGVTWENIAPNGFFCRVGDNHNISISTKDSKAYYSADWGNSFTEITPSGYSAYFSVHIAPGDSLLFTMANTGGGFVRSSDHGATWQAVSTQFTVTQMKFHPSGRYFAVSTIGDLWFSDDFGLTWQIINGLPVDFGQGQFGGLTITTSGNILFTESVGAGERACVRSTDNGVTWMQIPTLPPFILVGNPVFENVQGHLFALGWDALYRSIDGGNTWQTAPFLATEYPELYSITNNVFKLYPSQYLYIGTDQSGLFRSTSPTDLGAYLYGSVKRDADADCSTEDGQVARLTNWVVEASGAHTFYGVTDTSGRFAMFIDTGYYDVSVRAPQFLWWSVCDSLQTTDLSVNLSADTLDFVAVALSECPLISVHLGAPLMRRCFDNQVYVQYCNAGTEAADSAWVDVALDAYQTFQGSAQPYAALGNNVYRFFIGDLQSGDCGQFQLTVNVSCDLTIIGQTHCMSAHGFPDTLCTTVPNWSGANLEAMVACQDSVVLFELENTGSAPSQVLDYIIIEDDVVMFQGSKQYEPNENLLIPVPANGHTYRLESEQEPGHPFSYRVIAFEEGCGGFESLGFINQFSVNGNAPSMHQLCIQNAGAYDPNDKQGFPTGTGDEHRIRPGQAIEYMIRFQNTGTDTAFTVVIRDTLTQWLNPATVTPGAASHPYSWTLEGQGVVKFTFNNILLPDSTTNLAGSQGFVTFSIAQQPDVPLGTQIRNDAAIFFDFNAPVITNETLHTVGVDLVSSTVDIPKQAKPAAVAVSPNPALDHTTFRLRRGNFSGHRLQLFDPLGKPVFDTEVSGTQFVMPRGQLSAGAYGWRVTDRRGGLVESGVLVFQ